MKINRRLSLVQPIELGAGRAYLHSMPIGREVWDTYFLILAKAYAAILSEGLTIISGPPIAKMLLKRIAMLSGVWDGPEGVERGLMAEIRRLSNVVMPGTAGWDVVPLESAMQRHLIDDDALAEAEGALVFFICASAVLRGPEAKPKLAIMMDGLTRLWGVQTTSSDVMAFAASLPISTPAASSGEKRPASSVPH